MYYSVKDLSNILGLTTNALRYFEKEHIINTKRTETGRRYYDISDVSRILSYKKYSSMGMPLKDIARQFSDSSEDKNKILARIESCLSDTEQKLEHYQELSNATRSQIQSIRLIDRLINNYEIAICPECDILYDTEHGLISTDLDFQKIIRSWLEYLPSVKQSAFLPAGPDGCCFDKAALGFSAPAHIVARHNLPTHTNCLHIAAVPCIHTITCNNDFFNRPFASFSNLLEYMEQKNLLLDSTAWGQMILVECGPVLNAYLEIWAPFQFK